MNGPWFEVVQSIFNCIQFFQTLMMICRISRIEFAEFINFCKITFGKQIKFDLFEIERIEMIIYVQFCMITLNTHQNKDEKLKF